MKEVGLALVLGLIASVLSYNPLWCQELKTSNVRIAWDYSSAKQLAEEGGYPRLCRLQDSSLITLYETRRGGIHMKKSRDEGMTWSEPLEVFSQFVYSSLEGKSTIVSTANPEIKQLQNGDLIIACNYRPLKAEIAPYSIVVRRSKDNGFTWSPPQVLYSAAPRFGDGCWEPSFLQLPDGEVQVYFANEKPYRESDEQEISLLYSQDNGLTWSKEIKTVSFRKGRRDGMPVPILAGEEVVVAIEDNAAGEFKPYTVRTKIKDNWQEPVLADSKSRSYALQEPLSDTIYMGAPYLLRLSNGQTLLSYQTNENRLHEWAFSTMEVAVGDTEARNFERRTRPFDVPLTKEAKWNSLALWDKETVVALSSSNFRSANVAPWLIKGYIISDISLQESADESGALFIGAKDEANLKAKVWRSDGTIRVKCMVSDLNMCDSSGVSLFFQSKNTICKLWSSPKGVTTLYVKKGTKWKKNASLNQIVVRTVETNNGYDVNYQFPVRLIAKESERAFRLGFAFSACKFEKLYTEYLSNMEEENTDTWINVFK